MESIPEVEPEASGRRRPVDELFQEVEPEENDRQGLVEDCRVMLRYARKNAFPLTEELIGRVAQLDRALKERHIRAVSDIAAALVGKTQAKTRPRIDLVPAEPLVPAGGAGLEPHDTANPRPHGTHASIDADAVADNDDVEILLMNVHAELSRVIAPATALTLIISEPPPGRHRIFGGMPLLVKVAAGYAIFSAVLFVIGTGAIAQKKVAEAVAKDKAAKAEVKRNSEASATRPGAPVPAASAAAQSEPKAKR